MPSPCWSAIDCLRMWLQPAGQCINAATHRMYSRLKRVDGSLRKILVAPIWKSTPSRSCRDPATATSPGRAVPVHVCAGGPPGAPATSAPAGAAAATAAVSAAEAPGPIPSPSKFGLAAAAAAAGATPPAPPAAPATAPPPPAPPAGPARRPRRKAPPRPAPPAAPPPRPRAAGAPRPAPAPALVIATPTPRALASCRERAAKEEQCCSGDDRYAGDGRTVSGVSDDSNHRVGSDLPSAWATSTQCP